MENPYTIHELLLAASQSQWKKFDRIIDSGRPINEIHPQFKHCIATVIAGNLSQVKGDVKTILDELINRGADLRQAAKGAAMANRRDLLDYLLLKGDCLNQALYGAGLGGHSSLVDYLLAKPGADVTWAWKGACRGQNQSLLSALTERQSLKGHGSIKDFLKHGDMDLAGLQLFREMGVTQAEVDANPQRFYEMLLRKDLKDRQNSIENLPLFEFGLGGKEGEILHYIARNPNLINHALAGAAVGGHLRLVKTLLSKGAHQKAAAWGFAFAEDRAQLAIALRSSDPLILQEAVKGAAAGGHPELLRELFEQGGSPELALQSAKSHNHPALVSMVNQYLDEIAERCLNELSP